MGIQLQFDKFWLEEQYPGYPCDDYVEIIDGEFLSDRVIFGPQCDQLDPFTVKSSGNRLLLIFVSDWMYEEAGIIARYRNGVSK